MRSGEAEAQDWEAVRPGVKCLQECEDFLEERASWTGRDHAWGLEDWGDP